MFVVETYLVAQKEMASLLTLTTTSWIPSFVHPMHVISTSICENLRLNFFSLMKSYNFQHGLCFHFLCWISLFILHAPFLLRFYILDLLKALVGYFVFVFLLFISYLGSFSGRSGKEKAFHRLHGENSEGHQSQYACYISWLARGGNIWSNFCINLPFCNSPTWIWKTCLSSEILIWSTLHTGENLGLTDKFGLCPKFNKSSLSLETFWTYNFLLQVTEEYRLLPDTLYLTVNYIDRYLSGNVMSRQKLQLLGVACMMIAA